MTKGSLVNVRSSNDRRNFVLVYKMELAVELQKMGHQLFCTQPNPKKAEYVCWVFIRDETIYDDLNKLIRG